MGSGQFAGLITVIRCLVSDFQRVPNAEGDEVDINSKFRYYTGKRTKSRVLAGVALYD